jgi:hypothetical protein
MGYEVGAIELIDPEETPKNVLIRGVKKGNLSEKQRQKLLDEYKEICRMLSVQPYLAQQYKLL